MAKFTLGTFVCILLVVESYATVPWLYNGKQAEPGQFPFTVSIQNYNEHNCGGAIISPNFIVTAASCVSYEINLGPFVAIGPTWIDVRIGTSDYRHGGEIVRLNNVTLHEGYDGKTNNIALLQLRKSLKFTRYIKSIPLQTTELQPGTKVTLIGWPTTRFGTGVTPQYLKYTSQLTSISSSECNPTKNQYTGPLLCLAHETGIGGCSEDDGDPAVSSNKLVGIHISYLFDCSRSDPDGYVKISHYAEWIKQKTGI